MSGVSPKSKAVTVTHLGYGDGLSRRPLRLYPGDTICLRNSKPGLLPCYGVILSPENPLPQCFLTSNQARSATLGHNPTTEGDLESSWNRLDKCSTLPPPRSSRSTMTVSCNSTGERELSKAETIQDVHWGGVLEFSDIPIPAEEVEDPICVYWTIPRRVGYVRRSDIGLVNRNLYAGQRVKNECGIEGTIMSTRGKAILHVLDPVMSDYVIDDVAVEDLIPTYPLVVGREIQYKGWIGTIHKVTRRLTCKLDKGGCNFSLNSDEMASLLAKDPYWVSGMPHLGMRQRFPAFRMRKAVFATPMMRFLHRWVRPVSTFYTRSTATVQQIETVGIHVAWFQQCPSRSSTSYDSGRFRPPPPEILKEDFGRVKLLGLPSYETAVFDSIRMHKIHKKDAVMSTVDWHNKFQAELRGESLPAMPTTSWGDIAWPVDHEIPVRVICRQTEVKVEWDNGVSEQMLASRVSSILPWDDHSDYQPGVVVVTSDREKGKAVKYGVIVCNDIEPEMVRVHWLLPGQDMDDVIDLGEWTCSIHNLKIHPHVSAFQRGLTVFLHNHPEGYETGTVVDFDLYRGQLLLAVPETTQLVPVYPHVVTPAAKLLCSPYWDSQTRKWNYEPVVLLPEKVSKDVGGAEANGEELIAKEEKVGIEEEAERVKRLEIDKKKEKEVEQSAQDKGKFVEVVDLGEAEESKSIRQ